jgi:two-component system, chemotaxis family, protein-glutamate methylesterase/glutaminase
VIVVGASAGGVEALIRFVGALPADLAAVVLIVLHVPARAPSALATILARHGRLPTRTAGEDEPLIPGHILVAPPDHHLVVTGPDRAASLRGPRENGHRPAIDALFRTAAAQLRERVVAVVLSGSDDDGTAGALAVREGGGLVFTQSEDDAIYAVMPSSAARVAGADLVGLVEKLGVEAARVTGESVLSKPEHVPDPTARKEAEVDAEPTGAVLGPPVGPPSGFVCPDCSGALFVVTEQPVLRFRCRIGHGWTADSLVAQQDVTVETALWTAVRTLQEKGELAERLARRAESDDRPATAEHFHESAREAHNSARILRDVLSELPAESTRTEDADVS